ncbi:hypothetical protein [Ideonella sp.]|uniref:alpha-L-rhamnosidase-related protein n=1 Tax=Ideonella sp. TaxID=1929293 RepID=UPI003BB5BA47
MPANETPTIPQGEPVPHWLALAEALTPALYETEQQPLRLVAAVADASHPLRYRMEDLGDVASLAQADLRAGDSFILDFGGHRTGYLSFLLGTSGREPDAPARLRLTFGEVPTDVAESFEPYTAWLSRAWLPDEVVNIDDLPQSVRLPRRYAFRYVKVEVIATSKEFGLRFEDIRAYAVTSAKSAAPTLPTAAPAWARRVDEVSIATLRDCLQTTFEDGPRRDRRLWVGDLRLQALVNYETYQQNDVVKRCLYLFAGLPRADGLVNACVYEKPRPTYANIVALDYAALYNATLAEYVAATGDIETGRDLWPVARRQLEILGQTVNESGLFVDPGDTWLFIDWNDSLHRDAAIQGVLIIAYRKTLELARIIGLEHEVPEYPEIILKMVSAARRAFFDAPSGLYLSGPDRQVSIASQSWMILAGVPESDAEAVTALRQVALHPGAIQATTPYLVHYYTEAMFACGMQQEALAQIQRYWGGMVAAGADTFWEAYSVEKPLLSPYGDIHVNSYCHAWSCTPAYFFRKCMSFEQEASGF